MLRLNTQQQPTTDLVKLQRKTTAKLQPQTSNQDPTSDTGTYDTAATVPMQNALHNPQVDIQLEARSKCGASYIETDVCAQGHSSNNSHRSNNVPQRLDHDPTADHTSESLALASVAAHSDAKSGSPLFCSTQDASDSPIGVTSSIRPCPQGCGTCQEKCCDG